MTPQTDHSQRAFRIEGTILTGGVESYSVVPLLPSWLNPSRRRARRRAVERVAPGVSAAGDDYTDDRWTTTFRLTDVALDDLGDRFALGWAYTLRLSAADRAEARTRAETFLDESRDIAEYTMTDLHAEQPASSPPSETTPTHERTEETDSA